MFVHMSVHRPHSGKESIGIASMHRFCEAARTQPGLQQIHTLQDVAKGVLVGLAIWDGKEAFMAARPAIVNAMEAYDSGDWEESVEGFRLEEI